MLPDNPSLELVAHIDGASRGNPGPAAYAAVLETTAGEPVDKISGVLGQATNNVAEYQALLAVLDYAHQRRHRRLSVFSDSELLVLQMQGAYRVKSPDLKPLHERAREMAGRLERFSIEYVPREQNREADWLANQALDGGKSDVGGKFKPLDTIPPTQRLAPLRASATFRRGALVLHQKLPLAEGEEVDLEIRRKK